MGDRCKQFLDSANYTAARSREQTPKKADPVCISYRAGNRHLRRLIQACTLTWYVRVRGTKSYSIVVALLGIYIIIRRRSDSIVIYSYSGRDNSACCLRPQ